MGKINHVSRRSFLVTTSVVGGGMAIGLQWSAKAESEDHRDLPWANGIPGPELTPWLSIAPDNTVTVRCPTPEIGNGVFTQALMTIAEELPLDLTKARVEHASPLRNFTEGKVYENAGLTSFFSGRSTNADRIKLALQVGASARERLKAAAAAQWKVPVADVVAANSMLTHTASGRTLKYGDVAAKAAAIKLAQEPAPKPRDQWTSLGKTSPGKITNPAVVNGTAVYGMDVKLPGMVYAALRQSPVHGGKIKSLDHSVARKMPGVLAIVTVNPDESPKHKEPLTFLGSATAQHAVAVIATHYWQARKALDAVRVEWDEGEGAKWKNGAFIHEEGLKLIAAGKGRVDKTVGDPAIVDKQAKQFEAVYSTPYCDHAPMEPLNGTALVTPDRVEIWHPSQFSDLAHLVASAETGVPQEKVVFNQTLVGGGFGRRTSQDDVRMVVAVAKKYPGKPVHVIWSREETTRQGRYRPPITSKMRAGLDASGYPQALVAQYAAAPSFGPMGLAETPYSFNRNFKVESFLIPVNLLTGAYRGPGYNSFAFIVEGFVDELAHAAGVDPVEYRLKLLEGYPDKGWELCLKEASSKAGWGTALPKGMGRGVAISNWGNSNKPETGTTVCTVATVEVSKKGALKVHQLDVAFDTGSVINRDAVVTEMVGGSIFGMNMALNEELLIRNGRVETGNYDQYPMLRMADVPTKINVHFGGLSGHERFAEVGEPPAGTAGPAIANAIFAATGKRIRSMPFRNHDLSWT